MADNGEQKFEPWFFEVEPAFNLTDDERDKVSTLEAAGRELVKRMVQQVAIDDDVPWEAMTPAFADLAIDRTRDAIHAARNAGRAFRARNDLEELAGRYMDTMRLWLAIHRVARARGE